MGAKSKFDQTKWEIERERLRLPDRVPPHPEPDLSLRGAITSLFKNLDGQTGSILQKIVAKWKIIAGENVAAHSRPGRLNESVLYVYVDSSTWLNEIVRLHADNIKRFLKKEFGANAVKTVRYQVNPMGSHKA